MGPANRPDGDNNRGILPRNVAIRFDATGRGVGGTDECRRDGRVSEGRTGKNPGWSVRLLASSLVSSPASKRHENEASWSLSKTSVQKPRDFVPRTSFAKNPPPGAPIGFDAKVIAGHRSPFPPIGFDSFGAPPSDHPMHDTTGAKGSRRVSGVGLVRTIAGHLLISEENFCDKPTLAIEQQ